MAAPKKPSLVPKNFKTDDFIINLEKLAKEYINECMSKTKEVGTGSGKVIEVKERNIPTIDYFLSIWIPMVKDDKTISRPTYYEWLKSTNELKFNTIKRIDDLFKGLAADIVANEGKGIFYAKNKLGWRDRQEVEHAVSADIGEMKFSMKRRE